jgi:hypothetical protein
MDEGMVVENQDMSGHGNLLGHCAAFEATPFLAKVAPRVRGCKVGRPADGWEYSGR